MAKIEIEAFYPFEPELVWDALTDRESLNQWLMENDFAPRVGHRFQFRTKPQGGWDGVVNCEVLEVKKPQLLSYAWAGGGHQTIVTWNLERTQAGTRLTLRHTGFRGIGGFVLSKLVLGPGWKKMLRKFLPMVLNHIKQNGLSFSSELKLKEQCH